MRIASNRNASHRITVDRAIDRHSGTHCRFCMLMCRSKLLKENLQLVLIYCALISAGRMRQERVERERQGEAG